MFVRLSVRQSGTGVHSDHTVHVSADLSLWSDIPMFWPPWHQSMSTYSQPSFSSATWKRGAVWMCKLSQERLKIEVKLLSSVDRKSYAASIDTTTDDLEWPWMAVSSASRAISAVAELLVTSTHQSLMMRYAWKTDWSMDKHVLGLKYDYRESCICQRRTALHTNWAI